MEKEGLTEAKRRILDLLKRRGRTTAAELADTLGLTDVAVRQHLQSLETLELVCSERQPAEGRGRPSLVWSLSRLASQLFPDRHSELTVGLIEAMRRAVGDRALERVIQTRAREQIDRYRSLLPGGRASLKSRIQALAELRTEEGYMAEVVVERPGRYLLVEHHCPICEAARCCTGLCSAELEVFQQALGSDVRIERTTHILAGDDRCTYRVRKDSSDQLFSGE